MGYLHDAVERDVLEVLCHKRSEAWVVGIEACVDRVRELCLWLEVAVLERCLEHVDECVVGFLILLQRCEVEVEQLHHRLEVLWC